MTTTKLRWFTYYTAQARALAQRYPHATDGALRSILVTDYAISRTDAASIVQAVRP